MFFVVAVYSGLFRIDQDYSGFIQDLFSVIQDYLGFIQDYLGFIQDCSGLFMIFSVIL